MSRRTRTVVEHLESRRLLSAAAWGVTPEVAGAWDALAADARHRLGVTEAEAAAQVATVRVTAPASSMGLEDVSYWAPLADASNVTADVPAVAFAAVDLDASGLISAIADAPRDAVRDAGRAAVASLPVLALPTPLGGVARFAVEAYDLLGEASAAQFPEISGYRIYGLDDATATGALTLTSSGVSAFVAGSGGDWQVRPLDGLAPGTEYASYFSAHTAEARGKDGGHPYGCLCEGCCAAAVDAELAAAPAAEGPVQAFAFGTVLRQYDAVFASTGEWTQSAGGTQQAAFNRIVTAVNDLNAIYRRDFSVELRIVSDLRTIYTDPATDGYSDNDIVAMLGQNQTRMDQVYGSANYDLGHAFSANGGGGVVSGLVGQAGSKARGVTGVPANSPFFRAVFLHEVGHQFSASHTWNTTGNSSLDQSQRASQSAYEPGPGSTIMSYGDIGYPGSFVTEIGYYFHNRSIEQVSSYTQFNSTGSGAATNFPTNNQPPQVTAPEFRVIPANTPFELTAVGTDAQPLTYTWEQYNLGPIAPIGVDNGNSPLFRSRDPSPNPTRMFPELADILANRSDPDERLPSITRTFNPLVFRVTARDGLGGVRDASVSLPVINTGAAFEVTSQNAPGLRWRPGSAQTVTWNVAGTTENNINAANVDVLLSLDNGQTFSPLLTGVPNNGQASINVPFDAPDNALARVKVKASDNYFFDINNAPITIDATVTVPPGLPATLTPAQDGTAYLGPDGGVRDADFALFPGTSTPFIDNRNDVDSYLVGAGAAGVYTFTAVAPSGSFIFPVLAVYDAQTGNPLAGTDFAFGAPTVTSLQLNAGQRVIVAVADQGNNIGGDVDLSVTGPAAAVFPVTLDASGRLDVQGGLANLSSPADSDFFAFTAPADANGTGSVGVRGTTINTVLGLYDASDNLLAFANAAGTGGLETLSTAFTPGAVYRVRVGSADFNSGSGDYRLTIDLGVGTAVPDAPAAPDLRPADDTGTSDSDNLTSRNNNLGFVVVVTPGTFVRLFRDGVLVAGPTQADASGLVTLVDATGPLADGTYAYTATAAQTAASDQSPTSPATAVTVDTAGPRQTNFLFEFNRGTAGQSFRVGFDVPGLPASAVIVRNLTTGNTLPASAFVAEPLGGGEVRLVYSPTAGRDILPDGRYEVTVPAGVFADAAGNPNAAFVGRDFFLQGDSNRDGVVNISDFATVRSNFGRQNAVFSQGDFNYDGIVNISDFAIVRSAFGRSLPQAAPTSLFAGEDD